MCCLCLTHSGLGLRIDFLFLWLKAMRGRGRGGRGTASRVKAGEEQAPERGKDAPTIISHGAPIISKEDAARKTVAKQELFEDELRRSVVLYFCCVWFGHCHKFPKCTHICTQTQFQDPEDQKDEDEDEQPSSKRARMPTQFPKVAAAADALSECEADEGEDDMGSVADKELDGEHAEEGEEEEACEADLEVDEEDDEPAAKAPAAPSQKTLRPSPASVKPKSEVPVGAKPPGKSWSLPKPAVEAEDPKTPNLVVPKFRVAVGAGRSRRVLIICFGCSAKSTALLGKRSSSYSLMMCCVWA